MWFFGRKKKKYADWFDQPGAKKEKRRRLILNIAVFSIIAFVLITSSVIYFRDNNIGAQINSLNTLSSFEMHESDLNLIWSKNCAHVEVMQDKCAFAGLDKIADEINALTIQSETNAPTNHMHLNYDEVAFFANTVLSFTSTFILIDFVWEINDNIATITTHFSYSMDNFDVIKAMRFYFEEQWEYNFEDYTIKENYAKILNVSKDNQQGSTITDPKYLMKLRVALTQFILQSEPTAITDISKKSGTQSKDEADFVATTNKTLCQMLGYSALDFTLGGIDYIV